MYEGVFVWLRSLPVAVALAVLTFASLLAAGGLYALSARALRTVRNHTETAYDDILVGELRLPVVATAALAGVAFSGAVLDVAPATDFYLRAAGLSVVAVVWVRGFYRLGNRLIRAIDEGSERTTEFAPIFANVWSILVVAGGGLALLRLWQVDVTPLLASAGVVGIAVGFAARDTIANFFGSISLYADRTYAVGDYVVLDTGEAGTVLDVTVRSTRLLTRDNVVVTVPNSVLNAARITNHSDPGPKTRVKVRVGVAYGSDPDEVEERMLAAADAVELVARAPEPRVRFRSFGDSALNFELLCWVRSPLLDARAVHELNREVYREFTDAGVEIPFPQHDVHVRGEGVAANGAAADDPKAV